MTLNAPGQLSIADMQEVYRVLRILSSQPVRNPIGSSDDTPDSTKVKKGKLPLGLGSFLVHGPEEDPREAQINPKEA